MRTLPLLLAASTLLVVSTPARASAGNPGGNDIRLVETSSQPRPGGGQRVHYAILVRVEPLLAVRGDDAAPAVTASDVVGLSYDKLPEGWMALGSLTVDQYGPHGQAASIAAPASSSLESDAAPAVPMTLALAPVRPDPASGHALVVDVVLPSADGARLEMMDVMGRRVATRELGSLGVGQHSVNLSEGLRSLAPGVYLLRLTQGREARTTRVTIVD